MADSPNKSALPAALVISPENVERLRQILHTESLTSDEELFVLMKDALASQYRRGVKNANEAAKGGGRPSRSKTRLGGSDSWEQHRRAQRKARFKNLIATGALLLLAATGVTTAMMVRPPLSASNPLAKRQGN